MTSLKRLVKKIPLVAPLHQWWVERQVRQQLHAKSAEQIFTEIHDGNSWGGQQSVSGPGSDLSQTAVIIREIPLVLRKYGIRSMLDAPCGDFNWMCHVDRKGVHYTGADIVKSLVENNNFKYRSDSVHFIHLDLIAGPLPKVELVFCRDCLVHLSHRDVSRCLANMAQSGSAYLFTTIFPDTVTNRDIATGHWRSLNLTQAPFHFPPPLELINEHCTEKDGTCSDKSLALWRIADLTHVIQALPS